MTAKRYFLVLSLFFTLVASWTSLLSDPASSFYEPFNLLDSYKSILNISKSLCKKHKDVDNFFSKINCLSTYNDALVDGFLNDESGRNELAEICGFDRKYSFNNNYVYRTIGSGLLRNNSDFRKIFDSLSKKRDESDLKKLDDLINKYKTKFSSDLMLSSISIIKKDYDDPYNPSVYLDYSYQKIAGSILDINSALFSKDFNFHVPLENGMNIKDEKILDTLVDLRYLRGNHDEPPTYSYIDFCKKYQRMAGAKEALARQMSIVSTKSEITIQRQAQIKSFIKNESFVNKCMEIEDSLQKYELDFLECMSLSGFLNSNPAVGINIAPGIDSSEMLQYFFYGPASTSDYLSQFFIGNVIGSKKVKMLLSTEKYSLFLFSFKRLFLDRASPFLRIFYQFIPVLKHFLRVSDSDLFEVLEGVLGLAGYGSQGGYSGSNIKLGNFAKDFLDLMMANGTDSSYSFNQKAKSFFCKYTISFSSLEFLGDRIRGILNPVSRVESLTSSVNHRLSGTSELFHALFHKNVIGFVAEGFRFSKGWNDIGQELSFVKTIFACVHSLYRQDYNKFFRIILGHVTISFTPELYKEACAMINLFRGIKQNETFLANRDNAIKAYIVSLNRLKGLSKFLHSAREMTYLCLNENPEFVKNLKYFKYLEEFSSWYDDSLLNKINSEKNQKNKTSLVDQLKSIKNLKGKKFIIPIPNSLDDRLRYVYQELYWASTRLSNYSEQVKTHMDQNGEVEPGFYIKIKRSSTKLMDEALKIKEVLENDFFKTLPMFLKNLNLPLFRSEPAVFWRKDRTLGFEHIALVTKMYRQMRDLMPYFVCMYHALADLVKYCGYARMLKDSGSNGRNKFCIPRLDLTNPNAVLCFNQFWYPLAFLEKDKDLVNGITPSNINLGCGAYNSALITGPNTAGKSVSMRGITTCPLSNQSIGLIPAESGVLSADFGYICSLRKQAENGARGKSSHEGQLEAVRERINGPVFESDMYEKVIVSIDEILSGTNIYDIQTAIWMYLNKAHKRKGACFVISSHSGVDPSILPPSCLCLHVKDRVLQPGCCDITKFSNSSTANIMQSLNFPSEDIKLFEDKRKQIETQKR